MKTQSSHASKRRILRPSGDTPQAAGPTPLRRWSVAELILQATLLGHPTLARTPGA